MDHLFSIQKALAAREMEAIFLTGPSNVFYATGFPGFDCTALVTGSEAWLFTDGRYIEAAENAVKSARVVLTDRQHPLAQRVKEVLSDCGIRRLGVEERSLSYADYLNYKEKLGVELVSSQVVMDELRAVKTPEEVEIMVEAQRIAEKAFTETLSHLRMDMTESEFAAELTYRMILHGGSDKSFDPIVVSGEKSSMPHGVPENRVMRKGFLTIDFGVKYKGYCSDTTRTVCLGEPTAEMRKVYGIVREAQEAGIAAAKGGMIGSEVDAAARRVIEEAGYGQYFTHSFGHSLGIDIHEGPNAAPTEKRTLPVGAVVSAEPGIYIPGRFGVRIEDVMVLGENGATDITNLPKDLLVL